MAERDLSALPNSIEWNLVGRRQLQRPLQPEIVPIPPQTFLIQGSYVAAVGVSNPQGKEHWKLGCWASMSLPVSPSSTSDYLAVMRTEKKICWLSTLTLLVFPRLVEPWYLTLDFPKWHTVANVEVWRFDGEIV